jgi:hypothetical protein
MAHAPVNKEDFSTSEGFFQRVTCSCGEDVEAGPEPTALQASVLATDLYGAHVHGA